MFVILVMTGGRGANRTSLSGTLAGKLAAPEHRAKKWEPVFGISDATTKCSQTPVDAAKRGVGEPILWWAGPPQNWGNRASLILRQTSLPYWDYERVVVFEISTRTVNDRASRS